MRRFFSYICSLFFKKTETGESVVPQGVCHLLPGQPEGETKEIEAETEKTQEETRETLPKLHQTTNTFCQQDEKKELYVGHEEIENPVLAEHLNEVASKFLEIEVLECVFLNNNIVLVDEPDRIDVCVKILEDGAFVGFGLEKIGLENSNQNLGILFNVLKDYGQINVSKLIEKCKR